jgi:hypothetical protein
VRSPPGPDDIRVAVPDRRCLVAKTGRLLGDGSPRLDGVVAEVRDNTPASEIVYSPLFEVRLP